MVGAILTQNTNWKNVEKAIAGLKQKGLLTPESLASADLRTIESAIRSSGYYRQKAKRLKLFAKWLVEKYDGRLDLLFAAPLSELRQELLSLNGIGPETADSILLYAGDKPVFVIDAYTRRVFGRMGFISENASYCELQRFFESSLPSDVELFKDFHAQIVELGKTYCKKKPLCADCPLRRGCKSGGALPKSDS
jgi:endonuclease-3 related protein